MPKRQEIPRLSLCLVFLLGLFYLYLSNFYHIYAQTPSNTVDFLYDGSGQRIYKGVNGGEHTYYVSPGIEVEISPQGSVTYRKNYYFSGKLVAVKDNSQGSERLNYIHQDHLGSTSLVTSNTGQVVSQQVYYPYGSTRTVSGALPSEREYTGQISDQDTTGLYYYNARYYNPQIAKFISADFQGDTLNKYAYVGNNPIIFTDPTGHQKNKQPIIPGANCQTLDCLMESISVTDLKNILEINPNIPMDENELFIFNMLDDFKENNIPYNYLTTDDANYIKVVLNSLSRYIFYKIPYAPQLTELWKTQESTLARLGNDPSIEEAIGLSEQYINALSQEGQIWDLKSRTSLVEQFEQGLFVCYNFADTFALMAHEILPDVPIYAGGVPGHAFNIVIIDNQIYTIDPTWNWPLMLLENDKKARPYFDWSVLDVNPKLVRSFNRDYFLKSLQYNGRKDPTLSKRATPFPY